MKKLKKYKYYIIINNFFPAKYIITIKIKKWKQRVMTKKKKKIQKKITL